MQQPHQWVGDLQSYADSLKTLIYHKSLTKSLIIIFYHTSRHLLLRILNVALGQQLMSYKSWKLEGEEDVGQVLDVAVSVDAA